MVSECFSYVLRVPVFFVFKNFYFHSAPSVRPLEKFCNFILIASFYVLMLSIHIVTYRGEEVEKFHFSSDVYG